MSFQGQESFKNFEDLGKVFGRPVSPESETKTESPFDPEQYLEGRSQFEQETQRYEADPSTEEGKATIIEAAESHFIDQIVTYDTQTQTVEYNWDLDDIPSHPTFENLDQLQQQLYGSLEVDAEEIQTRYEAVKQFFPDTVVREQLPEVHTEPADESEETEPVEFTPDVVAHEQLPQVERLVDINPGVVTHEVTMLLRDVEETLGETSSDSLRFARIRQEEILERLDVKPDLADAAYKIWYTDLMRRLDDLKNIHQNRHQYAAAETDQVPATVLQEPVNDLTASKLDESQETWHGQRLEPVSRTLSPTDLGQDGSVTIASPQVSRIPKVEQPPAEQPLAELLAEHGQDGLESSHPDASAGIIKNTVTKTREARQERRQAERTQERVKAQITAIEKPNWFERRFDAVHSPVEAMAELPYEHFETLVSLTKPDFNRFVAQEYRGKEMPRYELFQKWSDHLSDLRTYADKLPLAKRTTQAVITEYLANNPDIGR